MDNLIFLLLFPIFGIVFYSCSKVETDVEKPEIINNMVDAAPVNCDTLYFGEPHTLKILFKDNQELGSYSINIHNNFNGHSHTTEISACDEEIKEDFINPFELIQDYPIPQEMQEYTVDIALDIPSSDENGLFDEGDYHFFINLTDKEGWSAYKGISIKMLHR